MKKNIFIIVLIALFTTSAFAGYSKFGQAGCGLGSIAFGEEKGPIQILAMTTNGTSGSQTFGITSGTSNCSPNKKVSALHFIDNNKMSIEKEIAQGHGETLNVLAGIFGCQSKETFANSLQKYYSVLFEGKNLDAERLYDSLENLTAWDQELSGQCKQQA